MLYERLAWAAVSPYAPSELPGARAGGCSLARSVSFGVDRPAVNSRAKSTTNDNANHATTANSIGLQQHQACPVNARKDEPGQADGQGVAPHVPNFGTKKLSQRRTH